MSLAIREAMKAAQIGEVPVGAVIVKDNQVIASAYNMKENLKSATAHAEMIAIKKASDLLGGWRLLDCDIYVTLEPCVMCAGAIVQSRFRRVIFGAYDRRFGGCRSLYTIPDDGRLNHRVEIIEGVMEGDCSALLSDFFKKRREGSII
ncbi:tRNA adenosine(34) deaminase TadA [Clostridium sp.]|uniref:tRNA adenosine(34) deaminase TadA n=1 Tax=Clostridium sp. TaxID=1506 RepID=UPI003FA53E26